MHINVRLVFLGFIQFGWISGFILLHWRRASCLNLSIKMQHKFFEKIHKMLFFSLHTKSVCWPDRVKRKVEEKKGGSRFLFKPQTQVPGHTWRFISQSRTCSHIKHADSRQGIHCMFAKHEHGCNKKKLHRGPKSNKHYRQMFDIKVWKCGRCGLLGSASTEDTLSL